MDIDSYSFEKLRALAEVDLAITSSSAPVSSESKPNALRAEPAKSAALARSVPTAAANFSTGSCIAVICP